MLTVAIAELIRELPVEEFSELFRVLLVAELAPLSVWGIFICAVPNLTIGSPFYAFPVNSMGLLGTYANPSLGY